MKKFSLITKAFFTLLMLMAFLGLAACAKKTNGGASRAQRGTGAPLNANGFLGGNNINYTNGQPVNGIPAQQPSCAGNQSAIYLSQDGSSYGNFRANFAEFLGEEIGELGSNGVRLQLRLKVNGQSVIPQQSALAMVITDSYAAEQGDIEVVFDSAVSGNANGSTGDFTLTFQDNYGQVFVEGRAQGNMVQGRVSFQNSGGQTKSLGQFSTSSCAVLY